MTNQEAREYFLGMLKVGGYDTSGLNDYVDRAIDIGLSMLWTARPWSFRSKTYSLTCTVSAEQYELDGDFGGVRSARHQNTVHGEGLIYLQSEEFDHKYPHPTSYPSHDPKHYTIYKDSDKKWYAKFFPAPTAGLVIKMDMIMAAPSGDISAIPDVAMSALLACIEKYVRAPGVKQGVVERDTAAQNARSEILELERVDSPFMGAPYMFLDDTHTNVEVHRPWI